MRILISDRHGILDAGNFHYGFDGFLLEIFGGPKKCSQEGCDKA